MNALAFAIITAAIISADSVRVAKLGQFYPSQEIYGAMIFLGIGATAFFALVK